MKVSINCENGKKFRKFWMEVKDFGLAQAEKGSYPLLLQCR